MNGFKKSISLFLIFAGFFRLKSYTQTRQFQVAVSSDTDPGPVSKPLPDSLDLSQDFQKNKIYKSRRKKI